jgi:hypothetical protein
LKKWINIFFSTKILSAEIYLQEAKMINNSLFNFLIDNNFQNNWNKITQNSSSQKQIQKQKQIWFDGFKTLKLIHFLRDVEFPQINMFNALDELFEEMETPFNYKNTQNGIPNLEIQKDYLNKLREIA